MAKRNKFTAVALLGLLVGSAGVCALPEVQVNGLLPRQAVVTINGQQHVLKVGKPGPEGVVLVEADSKKAVFEWQGERFERQLSKQIASAYEAPQEKKEVRIQKGEGGHYFTTGLINNKTVRFMVDTGAFTVAMGMAEADRLGIDWRSGQRFVAGTAGGEAPGYQVNLKSVSVGDITVHNVQAAVIVADTSPHILLGMSFLEQTDFRQENNVLVLRKKY